MKKTKSFFVLFMVMAFGFFLLSSCKMKSHTHKYEWQSDDIQHWQSCKTCHENINHAGHSFIESVLEEATTSKEGKKELSCSVCGYKKEETIPMIHTHTFAAEWSNDDNYHWRQATCGHDEVAEKAEHIWNRGLITLSPTETEKGVKTYTCIICKATKEEELPVSNHIHSFGVKDISDEYLASEATCIEAAKYYYSCACGEACNLTFVIGQPLGHIFTNYTSNNDATCEADGTKTAKCERCAKTNTIQDIGSKIEHKFSKKIIDDLHLAQEADCEHGALYYYSCSMCGKNGTDTFSVGAPLGHSFTNYVSNNDATCMNDGTKTAKCDHCDVTDTIIEPNSRGSHSFTKEISSSEYLVSEASCTSSATYYYACEYCHEAGTTTYSSGMPLGHSFTNYTSNNDATCEADGTKTAKCDRCDVTNTITDLNSKLPHTYSNAWTYDDNYHWHSATCAHNTLVSNKGVHTFDDGEVTKEATLSEEGTKVYTCTTCGYEKTEVLPVLIPDHTHVYNQKNTDSAYLKSAADCENAAVYYYSCACGSHNNQTFEHGNALGHSFTTYVPNNDATCTNDGTKTAKCDRCDLTDTLTDDGSMLTHSFTVMNPKDSYLAIPATCESQAVYYYVCEYCLIAGTNTYKYGNALGHSFTNYVFNNNATCTTDGTKTAKCDRCDAIDTKIADGTATGHSFSPEWTYDENYHWHAATCSHTDEVSAYQAHVYDSGTIESEPSIYSDGYKIYKCECGYEYFEVLPMLPSFTVKFIDKNNYSITSKYGINTSPSSIIKPNSYYTGYRFEGWKSPSNIWFNDFDFTNPENGDIYIFNGVYTKIYTVNFVDYEDNFITSLIINAGSDISSETLDAVINTMTASNPNFYAAYNLSWNLDDVTNINSDRNICPIYQAKTYKVVFYDMAGNVLPYINNKGEEVTSQTIQHGMMAKAPEHDEYYLYDNGTQMSLCPFNGWSEDFSEVTSDLDVYAKYDTSKAVDFPFLVAKISGSKISYSIVIPANCIIFGFSASFSWEREDGQVFIISNVSTNKNTGLGAISGICGEPDACNSNKNEWVSYVNNESTFDINWACTKGHFFKNGNVRDAITVEFALNDVQDFKNSISLVESSVVYGKYTDDNDKWNIAIDDLIESSLFVYTYEDKGGNE